MMVSGPWEPGLGRPLAGDFTAELAVEAIEEEGEEEEGVALDAETELPLTGRGDGLNQLVWADMPLEGPGVGQLPHQLREVGPEERGSGGRADGG